MARRRLSESEVGAMLSDVLDERSRPYTWVTGELDLVLGSDKTVHGTLERVVGPNAIVRTARGVVEVPLSEVEDVILYMSSPGPE
jgi:hypothetical protein